MYPDSANTPSPDEASVLAGADQTVCCGAESPRNLESRRRRVPLGLFTGPSPIEIVCPCLHQDTSALEQVRTRIGRFHLVANRMGQRGLGDFTRCVGTLAAPVPEARPEAVRHSHDTQVSKQRGECAAGKCAALRRRENQTAAAPSPAFAGRCCSCLLWKLTRRLPHISLITLRPVSCAPKASTRASSMSRYSSL